MSEGPDAPAAEASVTSPVAAWAASHRDGRGVRWVRLPLTTRPLGRRRVSQEPAERFLGFMLTAAAVGALTGLVAAAFRWALAVLDRRRTALVHGLAPHHPWAVVVFALGCSAATALAAWLVHRVEPHAEGSGIPRVEAIVEGRTPPGRARILPVKFLGGLLSIGSGLALGREGPSVQMGGNIAVTLSRLTRRDTHDMRVLTAAGAAAGLATAFNAPIAGGVFVLEELVKRFDPRTTLATLTASAAGFGTAHLFVHGTDFHVPLLREPALAQAPEVAAVGLVTGLLGVLYNRSVMLGLRLADRSRTSVEARAGVIGLLVGVLGWFAPRLVGGGDHLTADALTGHGTIAGVALVLLVRSLLGVVSYAACTPGGLFAPMLVLGSDLGLLVGLVSHQLHGSSLEPASLALVGFASFFTATVRAPVTGIILATEMTGSTVMLAPTLGACAVSMLVATLMRSEPIYDALAARSARAVARNAEERLAAGTPSRT